MPKPESQVSEETFDSFAVLTQATREADEAHQTSGGGTRHWLRECFLPALEAHRLAVFVINERSK